MNSTFSTGATLAFAYSRALFVGSQFLDFWINALGNFNQRSLVVGHSVLPVVGGDLCLDISCISVRFLLLLRANIVTSRRYQSWNTLHTIASIRRFVHVLRGLSTSVLWCVSNIFVASSWLNQRTVFIRCFVGTGQSSGSRSSSTK